MKHYNIKVSGRVQGVFFRDTTRKMAKTLGIKGFVKNMYDGSVYIEAEGEEYQLQEFIKWCRKGPEYARVDNLEITEGEMKSFDSFEIAY